MPARGPRLNTNRNSNTRLSGSITSSRDEGRRRIGSINSAFVESTPPSMPLCRKNGPMDPRKKAISVAAYQLATRDAVTVWRTQAEFSKSPRFVGWFGCHQRPFGDNLLVELIHIVNVPIHEIRVISQFTRRSLAQALAKHHPKSIARQEAPSLGIDRIFAEAENVHVISR